VVEAVRALVLRVLRVPGEPHPPAGAPHSVRIFRAGKNFFTFRVFTWAVGQTFALGAIIFWVVMLGNLQRTLDQAKAEAQARAAAPAVAPEVIAPSNPTPPPTTATAPNPKSKAPARPRRSGLERVAAVVPPWLVPLLRGLEALGFIGYLAQLAVTYAVLRLDYEQRWYIVTDRSLRIRTGLWRLREITMSFANVQQVVVTRGPIQGWLKISDLRVQSAGGGGGAADDHEGAADNSLHAGVFHGVDNASEIRDLILERLRQFRAAGLGDPDDHVPAAASHPGSTAVDREPLGAARELLAEARALRQVLAG
jgi:hypothetical protein